MKSLSKEEVETIIRIAFKDGEQWGITHHTWFTPAQEQIDEQINQTINNIFKIQGLEE